MYSYIILLQYAIYLDYTNKIGERSLTISTPNHHTKPIAQNNYNSTISTFYNKSNYTQVWEPHMVYYYRHGQSVYYFYEVVCASTQ